MYSKLPSRPTAWRYEIGEMNIEIRQGGMSMVPEMKTSLPQDCQGLNVVAGRCQIRPIEFVTALCGIRQNTLIGNNRTLSRAIKSLIWARGRSVLGIGSVGTVPEQSASAEKNYMREV